MSTSVKAKLVSALPKDLLLSLEDSLRAEALKAHEIIRDHSGLKDKRRARGGEGQLRFRMMEERFEEVCQSYGGQLLEGGVIPATDLKVFQPFVRFEVQGQGIIFGLAAMPEPKAIPSKNKSRIAGVSLNYYLTPRLGLDAAGPKIGDIFVLLLVSRHRERVGQIEEIAIGIIDSKYENLLFYEPLDKFLTDYTERPRPAPPLSSSPQVKLKRGVAPFVPPEAPPSGKKETGTE
ncbi:MULTISPECIES: hypothetical protein [unclassified Mesorhizobium]|uniref:hypothetical protein n=1 Tax=unclassified Mesorhizobium TaxID=325217 RepID=UPI00112B3EB3|nr:MULTISPECIES: hypothetical protein [unclassified Mesorhizobium]MBZ9698983.1 hypothetical protein [Mesorhizobium sp. CO1-1-9]TPK13597.1 hypothetical protein FJ543_17680 [Mesorhizobium sp. B2-5-7]